MPAMVTWRGTDDGHVTDSVREIYVRYAVGGAGMIVLEATGVRDIASGPLLRLSHERFVPGLRALVAAMREHTRAAIVPQIIDFLKIASRKPTRAYLEGMVARRRLPESVLALSDAEFEAQHEQWLASARDRRDFLFGYRQTIADLSRDEIRALPDHFAGAARRAKEAGFDGVELHFAHAYTLASFLSVTNPREDEYGGASLANRLRLPLEVVEAVRGAAGAEFVVGARFLGSEDILNPDGSIGGNTLDDARQIAVALARAGLDFLSVSRGGKFDDAQQPKVGETAYPYTGHSGHACIPRDKKTPPLVNTFLARGVREAVRAAGFATPVVAAGKISTFEQAESLLQQGDADLAGMARALLADPDLPRKWRAGRDAEVRTCVFCPFCEEEDHRHRVVTCTLWPKGPDGPRHRLTPAVWHEAEG
ncbi:MAG: NADH:flavin oxidoreductase [Vicinamibacteria bacterium]|nr:NADH:flavin oxidoreductase [Vicinamibacteria bacterium]